MSDAGTTDDVIRVHEDPCELDGTQWDTLLATQAQPTSARDACGKRVFIALALCMEEKCDEARYRGTAECIPILDRKRARENR